MNLVMQFRKVSVLICYLMLLANLKFDIQLNTCVLSYQFKAYVNLNEIRYKIALILLITKSSFVLIIYYQVCNHPELFERREPKSPLHLPLLTQPVLPRLLILDPPISAAQHPKHSIFQAHKVHRKYLEVFLLLLRFFPYK